MAEPEKSPDEVIAALRELYTIRTLTRKLVEIRQEIQQQDENADTDITLAIELKEERGLLKEERDRLLQRLRDVQADIDAVETAIVEVEGKRTIQEKRKRELISNDYEPLKDQIDALRAKHDLPRLRNLHEEEEIAMAKLLEERRQTWCSSQELSPAPTNPPKSAPTTPSRARSSKRRKSSHAT